MSCVGLEKMLTWYKQIFSGYQNKLKSIKTTFYGMKHFILSTNFERKSITLFFECIKKFSNVLNIK